MSIVIEQIRTDVVSQERVGEIIGGRIPTSVDEIGAVASYASQFELGGQSSIDRTRVTYHRYNEDRQVVEQVTGTEYSWMQTAGNRDTWRLDQHGREFWSWAAENDSLADAREEARERLQLATEIDAVERMERAAELKAQFAAKRALRVPIVPLLRLEEVMRQETVALPVVEPTQPDARPTEVRSHRYGHERKQSLVSQALGFIAGKLDDWLGGAKFA